jgi:hypothetical protein
MAGGRIERAATVTPRLLDDESERRLRQLVAALRTEVLDALASRRRRSVWLEVVVEDGRVSEDSGLEARRYPLGGRGPRQGT